MKNKQMGKLSKQLRYIINLDDQYRESLINYTVDAFSDINTFLRKDENSSLGEFVQTLDDLDYVFEHVPPLEESIVVYRGVDYADKDLVINQLPSDMAFKSTSTKEYVGVDFASKTRRCCVNVITVTPGSKVLPLSVISEFPEEAEILLDRKGKLILTHETINAENKLTYLYLTYIPEHGRSWTS